MLQITRSNVVIHTFGHNEQL